MNININVTFEQIFNEKIIFNLLNNNNNELIINGFIINIIEIYMKINNEIIMSVSLSDSNNKNYMKIAITFILKTNDSLIFIPKNITNINNVPLTEQSINNDILINNNNKNMNEIGIIQILKLSIELSNKQTAGHEIYGKLFIGNLWNYQTSTSTSTINLNNKNLLNNNWILQIITKKLTKNELINNNIKLQIFIKSIKFIGINMGSDNLIGEVIFNLNNVLEDTQTNKQSNTQTDKLLLQNESKQIENLQKSNKLTDKLSTKLTDKQSDNTQAQLQLASADMSLSQAEERDMIDIKNDIYLNDSNNNNTKNIIGKAMITLRYLPEKHMNSIQFQMNSNDLDTPTDTNNAINSNKINNNNKINENNSNNLNNNNNNLNTEILKKQLFEELKNENEKIQTIILKQTNDFNKSINSMKDLIIKQNEKSILNEKSNEKLKNNEKSNELSIYSKEILEYSNLTMPHNVLTWRTVHVMAWLCYKLELPQYIETFHNASIDGLLLIKHINNELLSEQLNIHNIIHRKKIIEYINILKNKQNIINNENNEKLLNNIKAKELLKNEKINKNEKLIEKNEKIKKKQSKKVNSIRNITNTHLTNTYPSNTQNETHENLINISNRTKIMNQLKTLSLQKVKKHENINKTNQIWGFEYTNNRTNEQINTNINNNYENFMKNELFQTIDLNNQSNNQLNQSNERINHSNNQINELNQSNNNKNIRNENNMNKLYIINNNKTTDEIYEIIRNRMLLISNRLIEIEQLNYQKQLNQDNDLFDTSEYNHSMNKTNNTMNEMNNSMNQTNNSEKNPFIFSENSINNQSNNQFNTQFNSNKSKNLMNDSNVLFNETNNEIIENEFETDSILPPAYDDIDVEVEVDDLESLPPPAYDSIHTNSQTYNNNTNNSMNNITKTIKTMNNSAKLPETDRAKLIFESFINQKNNSNHWLGTNDKLTRLKFYGGLENLLKIRLGK